MATSKSTKANSKSTKAAAKKATKAAKASKETKGGTVTPIKPEADKNKPAAEKLPWLKREATKWTRLFTRAKVLAGRMTIAQGKKHSPDLVDAIEAAADSMKHLDAVICALSDGDDAYAPGGVGGKKGKAGIGDIVCFTEKGREKYKELVEENEFTDLTVLKIKGSFLTVKSKASGEKFKVPRGQVCIQATKSAHPALVEAANNTLALEE